MTAFFEAIRRLIRQLRQRRVIRVGAVYLGTSFVIIQAADILVPVLRLPGWTLRLVTLLLILGFPLAVGLAWVYNVTEEGLVRIGEDDATGYALPPHEGKPFTSNAVLVALLVLAIGLLVYPRFFPHPRSTPSSTSQTVPVNAGSTDLAATDTSWTPPLGERSVAVLPFTYLAAEDSADYFTVGMTDEILNRLSRIEGLAVTGRTSVMQYRETAKTIQEIGRELDVAHVVEGSVQLVGSRVRIIAQLIDARTGTHLWSDGYTRPYRDVLNLQVDLAREIARQLEVAILPEDRTDPTDATEVDSTAYALYLQARELRFRQTPQSLRRATDLLLRSVAADSTFAPAWALLSFCAAIGPFVGGVLPDGVDGDSLGEAAIRRAMELDPTRAETQIQIGMFRETAQNDFSAAGPHFQRAIELNPGLANAHRDMGLYLLRMGQSEPAESYLREAARLDPASQLVLTGLGLNDLYRKRYEPAKRHFREALALQPTAGEARTGLGLAYLGQDSLHTGLQVMRDAVERTRIPWTLAHLGWAYAQLGRIDSTRIVLARLEDEFEAPRILVAALHAAMGEEDAALDQLEHPESLKYNLKVHPFFDPLRDNPRFERLLEEADLDDATVEETLRELGEPVS